IDLEALQELEGHRVAAEAAQREQAALGAKLADEVEGRRKVEERVALVEFEAQARPLALARVQESAHEVAETRVADRRAGDVHAIEPFASRRIGRYPIEEVAHHPLVEVRHEAVLLCDRQEGARGHEVFLLLLEAKEDLTEGATAGLLGERRDLLREKQELVVLQCGDEPMLHVGPRQGFLRERFGENPLRGSRTGWHRGDGGREVVPSGDIDQDSEYPLDVALLPEMRKA